MASFPTVLSSFHFPMCVITREVKRIHQCLDSCLRILSFSLLLSGCCVTTHKPFVFMASFSRILSSSLLLSAFLASAPQAFCFHGFPLSNSVFLSLTFLLLRHKPFVFMASVSLDASRNLNGEVQTSIHG